MAMCSKKEAIPQQLIRKDGNAGQNRLPMTCLPITLFSKGEI